MISGATVNSSLDSFKSSMTNYHSLITDLSESWKGDSYSNLVSKAEGFLEDYLSTIENQLSSFATACDLYIEYLNDKRAYQQAESAYQYAVSEKDYDTASKYSQEMEHYKSEMDRLKNEIDSLLATASSPALDGVSSASGPALSIPSGELTDAQVEQLIAAARSQIGSPYNSMHYGPKEGDKEGFGCAMFVSYCYNQVLFGGASAQEKGTGGFYGSCKNYWGNVTKDNFDAYNKGFIEVDASEAKAGDIVCFVNKNDTAGYHSAAENCYHVGLYLGDGQMIHSSKFVTNGVGECSIDQYLQVRNNGKGVRYLRYVGTGALSNQDNDEEDKKNTQEKQA